MVKVKVKPNSTNLGTRQLMSLPPHTETKKVPGPGLLRIFFCSLDPSTLAKAVLVENVKVTVRAARRN